MTRFWMLILAGLMVSSIACSDNQQAPTEIRRSDDMTKVRDVESNRQATVNVMFIYRTEGKSVPEIERRTGIAVSPDYVLTRMPDRKGFNEVSIGISVQTSFHGRVLESTDGEFYGRLGRGLGHRFGLIRSGRKLSSQVVFSTAPAKPGEPHYAIEMMFGSYPSVHRGTVNDVLGDGKSGSWIDNLVIDALFTNAPDGESEALGAGVFNEDGALIGIVSHRLADNEFNWVAESPIELLPFLDRKGIEYKKIE